MTDSKPPYKRKLRNFLINRPLQMRNVSVLVGFSLLISLLFGFFVYYQTELYLDVLSRFVSADEIESMGFADLKGKLIACVATIIILNSIVLGAIGIVATHPVAGPLFRMEKQIKKLGEGDFSYLFFRKSDPCRSLEDAYNSGMDMLKTKFSDMEQSARDRENRLKSLLPKITDSDIRNEINDILSS